MNGFEKRIIVKYPLLRILSLFLSILFSTVIIGESNPPNAKQTKFSIDCNKTETDFLNSDLELPDNQFNLANFYTNCLNDKNKALKWFRKVALNSDESINNNAKAEWLYSWNFLQKFREEHTLKYINSLSKEDKELYEKGMPVGLLLLFAGESELGFNTLFLELNTLHPTALKYIEVLYETGISNEKIKIKKFDKRILKYFRQMAKEGIPIFQYLLGKAYFYSKSPPQDKKAMFWLKKSISKSNFAESYFEIGNLHYFIYKEHENAKLNWKKAGKLGSAKSYYNLGVTYTEEGDHKKAIKYLRKTIKLDPDFSNAYVNIGQAYFSGLGVEQNQNKSFKYYLLAANLNNPIGMFMVGLFYLNGNGVEQSKEIGLDYIRKSAESGFQPAKDYLKDK